MSHGKYYGITRGQRDCPCCPDSQTPQSAKKTARQNAKKEIEEEMINKGEKECLKEQSEK